MKRRQSSIQLVIYKERSRAVGCCLEYFFFFFVPKVASKAISEVETIRRNEIFFSSFYIIMEWPVGHNHKGL